MYATVQDMIDRFTEVQMIRLSNPDDRAATSVNEPKVNTALEDATVTIEGYVRGRYLVPIAVPPKDIVRAACMLARYDLADGEKTKPSTEMAKQRDDAIAWLRGVASEQIHLDLPLAQSAGPAVGSGPRMSDRPRIFSDRSLRDF